MTARRGYLPENRCVGKLVLRVGNLSSSDQKATAQRKLWSSDNYRSGQLYPWDRSCWACRSTV